MQPSRTFMLLLLAFVLMANGPSSADEDEEMVMLWEFISANIGTADS